MNTRHLLCAGALLSCMATSLIPAHADSGSVPAESQVRLKRLLVQDCGSCHGLRMTGGLGPALTPDRLKDTPKESLVATVLHGRPGTAMPGWQGLVTPVEAQWLIDQLLKGL